MALNKFIILSVLVVNFSVYIGYKYHVLTTESPIPKVTVEPVKKVLWQDVVSGLRSFLPPLISDSLFKNFLPQKERQQPVPPSETSTIKKLATSLKEDLVFILEWLFYVLLKVYNLFTHSIFSFLCTCMMTLLALLAGCVYYQYNPFHYIRRRILGNSEDEFEMVEIPQGAGENINLRERCYWWLQGNGRPVMNLATSSLATASKYGASVYTSVSRLYSGTNQSARVPVVAQSENNGSIQSSPHSLEDVHWKTLLKYFFISCSVLSYFCEGIRFYQEFEAERLYQLSKGMPPECSPDDMTVWQNVKAWLRWEFSWTEDPCLQYLKITNVNSVWKVMPLMIPVSILCNLVIYPVEIISGGLSRSLKHFFEVIPIQWQMLSFILFVIIMVLGIIMLCGYSIRLPFISLEPGRASRSVIEKEKDQNVSADNKLVKAK